jgi:tetratricopeptide (TPR) repeat protein
VSAAQSGFGIDNMNVVGAITQTDGKPSPAKDAAAGAKPESGGSSQPGLEMVLVVSQAAKGVEQTRIRQDENIDPVALVEQSAFWTMERIAPYRVVFAEFLNATRGNSGDMARARQTALRVLGRNWEVEQSSERALVYNALALMALYEQDLAQAEIQLRLADMVPGVLPAVRSALALNHALVATAQKRPSEAKEWFDTAMKSASSINLLDFDANLRVIEALVRWGNGDIAGAEASLRTALTASPESETAHFYLAQILDLKGDRTGSARELSAAQASRRFDPKQQALVTALYWVDPVKGEVRLRR